MEVLQQLPFAPSSELPNTAVKKPMAAAGVDACPRPSRSFRQWFFFGRSLCKDVAACSPSPLSRSVSSSQSSSRPGSVRSSSRFSFRQDESPSRTLIPHLRNPRPNPPKSGSLRRGSDLAIITAENHQKPQAVASAVEKQQRQNSSTRANPAARGYALALADMANTMLCLDAVNKDVEHIAKLLENDELFGFLVSPDIVDTKKKNILRTIADDVGFHECSSTFLYALVEKKRIALVKDAMREFEKIYNDLTDTQVATVTSAAKMDASELASVAKKIKSLSGASNVRAKNVVDPSLIAGYVITYDNDGSKYIDMSVKGQLGRLAPQFDSPGRPGSC